MDRDYPNIDNITFTCIPAPTDEDKCLPFSREFKTMRMPETMDFV